MKPISWKCLHLPPFLRRHHNAAPLRVGVYNAAVLPKGLNDDVEVEDPKINVQINPQTLLPS